MKVKIARSVYGNYNGKILDVSLTENGNYLYGDGVKQMLILKNDAEVVEEVEKSCCNCGLGHLLDCSVKTIKPCSNRDMWQPIEQAELTEDKFKKLEFEKDLPPITIGSTEDAKHYMAVGNQQPIEIMQSTMNPEQFIGFLMGNVIKYALRMNHKNKFREDAGKCNQYSKWLCQAIDGEIIVAGRK